MMTIHWIHWNTGWFGTYWVSTRTATTCSLPTPTSHAGSLHQPIYIFIGQLSSSLAVCLGLRLLGNRRESQPFSNWKTFSGITERSEIKLFERNHKHKPSPPHPPSGGIFLPAAAYHRKEFLALIFLSLLCEYVKRESLELFWLRKGTRRGRVMEV